MTVGTEPLGLGAQLEFEFAAKKGILEKATLYGVFRAARHKIASDLKIKVDIDYCKMHAIDSKQRV